MRAGSRRWVHHSLTPPAPLSCARRARARTEEGKQHILRRQAWMAKLPLSVLTDFEELASYDCRSRPAESDRASVGRVGYFTFEEYADRWRDIWDIYSREAVWGGSFDRFAQANKARRGSTTVDAEFLKEIEGWRDALARNLALRNPRLEIDELNDAVQRTIDRIIFLRMAENRGSNYQKAVAGYDRVIQLVLSNPIVCGHRLLALHHGWDAGVVSTVYLQGAVQAGCQ